MVSIRKTLLGVALVAVTGCAAQAWHHPTKGADELAADRAACEAIALQEIKQEGIDKNASDGKIAVSRKMGGCLVAKGWKN
jgi:hypothetical protein